MNRVAQPQAQQAPHLPRGAANQPRQEIIIDLISDDEDEGSGAESLIEFDEEEEDYVDAPQSPIRPQEPALGRDQQEAVFDIIDLMDPEPAPAPARPASPPPARNEIWGDYIIDDDFDAAEFARAIEFEDDWRFMAEPPALAPMEPRPLAAPAPAPAAPVQQVSQPAAISEPKDECIQMIAAVFPGICVDHVAELYNKISKSSERLIAHLLDQMDKGIVYPKAKDKAKDLKRKRDVDEIEEAARKYGAPDRVISANVGGIRPYIRNVLSHEFPDTPMAFIDATLSQSGHRLFSAYQLLDETSRTYDSLTSGYTKIQKPRKAHTDFREESIEVLLNDPTGDLERTEILRELRAARKYKAKADAKRELERAAALEEEENERRAQAEGTMKECACCFGDYPLNRMVHCDVDPEMHWFCRGCALRNAETEVGQSKYELCCMSMEGCDAKFTLSQRAQFLDEKTKIALERNEQEANLRLAGIENLASCPFCPFAAEYPPVEVDREFRCQAPDCEKISCRLCKLESHIPKSCEENAKETGLSVRRRIEEAMSAALIRKCNKCGTPFIKEEGCNKMRCTLKGCGNVQCYVCSKSCDYDHFDDRGRGGKPGNCPLFESVETRHDEEVSKAEKAALEQVRAEHPEYTEDDLKVKVSEDVKKDDEARRARDPRLNPGALGGPGYRAFPFQAMNAMRMEHHHHILMPRRPPPPRAGADPALPVLPNLPQLQPYRGPPPYIVPGRRLGEANPPDFGDFLDDVGDMGIFNMPWGDDWAFPPPPPGLVAPAVPPVPGLAVPPPLPGQAIPPPGPPAARPVNHRIMRFEDLLMQRQDDQPPLDAPGVDWRNLVGMPPPLAERRAADLLLRQLNARVDDQPPLDAPNVDWRNLVGMPQPLAERHAAADDHRQRENQRRIAALKERVAENMRRRRAEAVKNEAWEGADLQAAAGPLAAAKQRIAQVAAAREQAIAQAAAAREQELGQARQARARVDRAMRQQIRQARADIEMRLPNVVFPEAPQPPARPILDGADAVANMKARGAERRREFDERVGKVAVDLRLARLREVARNARNNERNEQDRQRRIREEMEVRVLQNTARALGRDGDVGFVNERLERLRQRLGDQNDANKEEGGLNEERENPAADAMSPRVEGLMRLLQAPIDLPPSRIPQPAAALRQKQILDHEERRIERSQQMARLRREQENDEAATAKRLARLRQAGAAPSLVRQPAHRQAPVVDLLSSSPETKKKATVFDRDSEADDEKEEDEDEDW